jgi:hypothetical protein
MTREKIQKLKAVGFVWLTRKSPTTNAPKKDGEGDQGSDDSSSSEEEEDVFTQNPKSSYYQQQSQRQNTGSRFAPWDRFKI